jgi:hypothetical protein
MFYRFSGRKTAEYTVAAGTYFLKALQAGAPPTTSEPPCRTLPHLKPPFAPPARKMRLSATKAEVLATLNNKKRTEINALETTT